nr:hypothetical protein [Tanacetum cinerariifolium]
MKESSFMLTLLIHGPKSLGKDIDVYMRPLIEDLKVLWDRKGVETIDVASGQKFNIRAMVLWTINDFPARSSLSGWSGQEDDMLKAQIKVVNILCYLELIYPHALFDIMIHLVIHLPLEALEGGPIRPQWMYPFERYMKKLKGYVRNKAKPKGSIAEGYVAKEALTFSSHYFQDVTTKFNRLDRNVDLPLLTCQFQVFRSVCKSIGLWSVIRFDAQELNKVKWYVLHNNLEIDTYRFEFKRLFPSKDMKEEFPDWFGSQVDVPPDIIIDVADEDDDITDDKDALPYDLAESDNEDLINVDDDGVDKMSADVARSHGCDGGGEDRPPPHQVPNGCMGCFANR